MAKRKSAAYMTAGEQIAGTVFFVIYLLVLPFATTPLFDLAERLLGTAISPGLRNALYYYILFAVTLIIFHGFLARTTRQFLDNPGGAVKLAAVGLVALYGLNELVYRLSALAVASRTNLNDTTISAQMADAPRTTILIVVFLWKRCSSGAWCSATSGARAPGWAMPSPAPSLRCCMCGSSLW